MSADALKQALLRPAHEWAMSVLRTIPQDGTYDQTRPLKRLSRVKTLFSYDLSSATDRFPLWLQSMIVSGLFNLTASFSWVFCGLGVNSFKAPGPIKGIPRMVNFTVGQPLGYLSSWPLFALSHQFLVWHCADMVYPGKRFSNYALLGDDTVIGDPAVAKAYVRTVSRLGVKISTAKSLISDIGGLEFAKTFRILDRDFTA